MPPSARAAFPHRQLNGALNKGVVVANGTTASLSVPTAGASVIRLRALVIGVDTTLRAQFLRPDGKTVYTENNPDDVDLTDGTESIMDITVRGESMLKISVVGDAVTNATISFIDIMGLPAT